MEDERAAFQKFRNPRRGTTHPEDLSNAFWVWAVKGGECAYTNNETFAGPGSFEAGPCWSFDRFGQSTTILPDGRTVRIAGEHEDSYDPDFYIYNDVVVTGPDGKVTILGYPEDIFPPTDFHTATQVGDELILIGSLGYTERRHEDRTQVLRLSLRDWRITPQDTTNPPGWISRHQAALSPDGSKIRVSGAQRWTQKAGLFNDFATWELDLTCWQWHQVERKDWRQFRLVREDGKDNDLFTLRNRVLTQQLGMQCDSFLKELDPDLLDPETMTLMQENQEDENELVAKTDLTLLPGLYRPALPHTVVPKPESNDEEDDEDHFRKHRIRVDGSEVLFLEDLFEVTMRVEGPLPDSKVQQILDEVRDKLAALERTPYRSEELP